MKKLLGILAGGLVLVGGSLEAIAQSVAPPYFNACRDISRSSWSCQVQNAIASSGFTGYMYLADGTHIFDANLETIFISQYGDWVYVNPEPFMVSDEGSAYFVYYHPDLSDADDAFIGGIWIPNN